MPGFACVIAKQDSCPALEIEYDARCPIDVHKTTCPDYGVYQFVSTKFPRDKILAEDEEMLILLDGIVLNLGSLRTPCASDNAFQAIKTLYQTFGNAFMKELRGEFSGLLYNKRKKTWLLFTNHTGTKPLFYFQDDTVMVVASELPLLAQVLQKLDRAYSLDPVGCYFLLTYGFMLEDYTLLHEVKKVRPGHYLHAEKHQMQVHAYHRFQNETLTTDSRKEIISNLDVLFKRAVALEYEKDREYGYQHLATLSGGLDSRMNIFTALELGYEDITVITFSQSDYLEEKIAKQIAGDHKLNYLFYALDNGLYLEHTLSDAVQANGGLALYSGAAHSLSFYRNINFSPFGLLHTGQIGDAVLGSFLSKPMRVRPQSASGAYSRVLWSRIHSEVEDIHNRYDSEELFKFYSRAFNGAVNGNWIAHAFTEMCSPFLDVDFMEYALRIPPALKFQEKIYRDWIINKRPAAAKYKWEQTGKKITAGETYLKVKRYAQKVKRKILRDYLNRTSRYSMNPFQYWYNTNPRLANYMQDYFQQNLFRLEPYAELKKDVEHLFHSGTPREKTQVMTLLETLRLYFS